MTEDIHHIHLSTSMMFPSFTMSIASCLYISSFFMVVLTFTILLFHNTYIIVRMPNRPHYHSVWDLWDAFFFFFWLSTFYKALVIVILADMPFTFFINMNPLKFSSSYNESTCLPTKPRTYGQTIQWHLINILEFSTTTPNLLSCLLYFIPNPG